MNVGYYYIKEFKKWFIMYRGGWDVNYFGIGSLSCIWVISCEVFFSC